VSRRRGIVIALSGADCAGKSTQRDLLMTELCARGYAPVNVYSRPGYSPGLRFVKRALRGRTARKESARSGVSPQPGLYPRRASTLGHPLRRRLWLAVALLDLLVVYGLWIRWLRFRGRAVLCNRYLLDALVDLRVNFPADRVEERWLWRLLRRSCVRPDASFCLLLPAEETLERARRKARYHWETLDVLRERLREYETRSGEFGAQTLDGLRPVAEIAGAIQRGLAHVLPAGELRRDARTSLDQRMKRLG